MKQPGQAPHAIEAERAVLGGILCRPEKLTQIRAVLESTDFYEPRHQYAFEVMVELAGKKPIDPLTVGMEIDGRDTVAGKIEGSVEYLIELIDATPTAENLGAYARIVREKSAMRQVIARCRELAAEANGDYGDFGEFMDAAMASLADIRRMSGQIDCEKFNSVFVRTLAGISSLRTESKPRGLPTGFRALDDILGGIREHELMILAGRPSMGKSALAKDIVTNVARQGVPTLVFTLEMGDTEYAERILASESQTSLTDVTRGAFESEEAWRHFRETGRDAASWPIWFDESPVTIAELYSKAVSWSAQQIKQRGAGLVVVDYLQLLRGTNRKESRQEQVAEISRGLKRLAKTAHIPVLALAQLSRELEKREDKRPMKSDLRESGAIENDADVIAFIFREEVYKPNNPRLRGMAEIIIDKRRNGETGTALLGWNSRYTQFTELPEQRGFAQ